MAEATVVGDGPGSGGRAVRFGVLGALLLTPERTPVRIDSGKQRTVLAVLLLRANQPISPDRLIDELWGRVSSVGAP